MEQHQTRRSPRIRGKHKPNYNYRGNDKKPDWKSQLKLWWKSEWSQGRIVILRSALRAVCQSLKLLITQVFLISITVLASIDFVAGFTKKVVLVVNHTQSKQCKFLHSKRNLPAPGLILTNVPAKYPHQALQSTFWKCVKPLQSGYYLDPHQREEV